MCTDGYIYNNVQKPNVMERDNAWLLCVFTTAIIARSVTGANVIYACILPRALLHMRGRCSSDAAVVGLYSGTAPLYDQTNSIKNKEEKHNTGKSYTVCPIHSGYSSRTHFNTTLHYDLSSLFFLSWHPWQILHFVLRAVTAQHQWDKQRCVFSIVTRWMEDVSVQTLHTLRH